MSSGIIILVIGMNVIKSNVSPLIADQILIKVLKSGERVIEDPAVTIQMCSMFFTIL